MRKFRLSLSAGILIGLVLGIRDDLAEDSLLQAMERNLAMLHATRPTGRNLGWALDRLRRAFDEASHTGVALVREALASLAAWHFSNNKSPGMLALRQRHCLNGDAAST